MAGVGFNCLVTTSNCGQEPSYSVHYPPIPNTPSLGRFSLCAVIVVCSSEEMERKGEGR